MSQNDEHQIGVTAQSKKKLEGGKEARTVKLFLAEKCRSLVSETPDTWGRGFSAKIKLPEECFVISDISILNSRKKGKNDIKPIFGFTGICYKF